MMAATSTMCTQTTRRYLLWCANEHIEFRLPELESIALMFNIPITWIDKPKEDPYVILEMNSENDARKLMSRSMLVRSCFELWGQGENEAELHASVKSFPNNLMKPHLAKEKTFKVRVESFNKTLSISEKLKKIESLSFLPFEGSVNLKKADTCLHLIEYYGLQPNEVPIIPFKSFLGRWVVEGQRELIDKFSLKRRTYIGSTSMDAQLAFIMSNCAQVQPGHVVVDPFVGTGSILVSAAHCGAYVWGWDIDYLTLHARTKPTRHSQKQRQAGESIFSNLKQYGLEHQYVDVVVMDNARPCWRGVPYVDAIITDPPYGIRESIECVGSLKVPKDFEDGSKQQSSSAHHFPSKITYSLSDIFRDLINFAAIHLVIGGRLVFWLPVFREDYHESMIPSHPCLELLFNSEQVLTVHSSRRLVTFCKTRHPQEGETATAQVTDLTASFREKFFQASLMTKQERASMKSRFPRDKRGQGLGYRLLEAQNNAKIIKMDDVPESETINRDERQTISQEPNTDIEDLSCLEETAETDGLRKVQRNNTDSEKEENFKDAKNKSVTP
ncbi:tRNA (guanine(10)-N2)-methyltransferase homolog [Homarus americanus]|uniref:tRNA (guanine(10)-N(2))-methyltransferase TRMT11 n=1 Tax=Homarus americanus TaxID=6706 RepID=A0A8J5JNY3_HOMAM|nr:tRNA (guanine(10)-N2)-methyltransferase homolog [Homarus americanus]KAG7159085.1 tRNA (guanine(10)-N2)-methyltransferase-like [Homarus americanus]